MGGWACRIGHYEVSQMDYYYDHIKDDQALEYYNSITVQVKFMNLKTGQKKMIDVPLIELHDFVEWQEGCFTYIENEDKSLRSWLWKKLQSSNIKITCAFRLIVFDPKIGIEYFLNSLPFDDDIQISTKKKEFELDSLDAIDWILDRGFTYAE